MMDNIDKIKEYIFDLFKNDFTGHDYYHSIRVYNNAMKISKKYNCDIELISIASLLHDVDDVKLFNTTNYENARFILEKLNYQNDFIEKAIKIIKDVSFKGKDSVIPETIEGQIVQDADRLDAIGAIGIARTFAFGGSHNRPIYDPNVMPRVNMSSEEYRNSNNPTINHFYEKLFLLKDLMNTKEAYEIAKQRDEFMKNFVEEFYKEIN